MTSRNRSSLSIRNSSICGRTTRRCRKRWLTCLTTSEEVEFPPEAASHQGDGIGVGGLEVECPERRFRPSEREIAEMLSKTGVCRLKGFNPPPARVSPVDDSHNTRYVNPAVRECGPPIPTAMARQPALLTNPPARLARTPPSTSGNSSTKHCGVAALRDPTWRRTRAAVPRKLAGNLG